MGVWRIGRVLVVLLVGGSALLARPVDGVRTAPLSTGVRAVLTTEHDIVLRVKPRKGDAWSRLSLRTTGDAANWKKIQALNGMGSTLMTDREVEIPFAMLSPRMMLGAIEALFPNDGMSDAGWVHEITVAGVEGESLWKIAEWFTGDSRNYTVIRDANDPSKRSTRTGERILVPEELLVPAFASSAKSAVLRDKATPARQAGTSGIVEARFTNGGQPLPGVVTAEDDPDENHDLPGSLQNAVEIIESSEPGMLEYDLASKRPAAIYRLKKGEALYSSVAIRFTGRVYAPDVNEVVAKIVEFNGIEDVAKLPVGFPVRIPIDLLTVENRPSGDPLRVEAEAARREITRAARPVRVRNLKGVSIILDSGHGGRDVGTMHDGIWESDYVYDVMCRLKKEIEKKTEAKVFVTTRSPSAGYTVSSTDKLKRRKDHEVLTTPVYPLENPVTGVHMRWYLANSIYRRAMANSVSPEKVVFLSIHADSLHPALRGAMAYVPGSKFVSGTFAKRGSVYLARNEVRESPSVTTTADEALRAEGLSTLLASAIIDAFVESDLEVHPFAPVRTNVVRNGREWVPAVIRYNRVPTRLLLEICNIGNVKDRALLKTAKYRQKVAEVVASGITAYFAEQDVPEEVPASLKAAAR